MQSLPPVADRYAADQRQEIGAAVSAARRVWTRGMTDDLDASFGRIESDLLDVMDRAQQRVIDGAVVFVPEVLADTNRAAARRAPDYRLDPQSLIGTSGDGLGTDTLAYEAVIRTKVQIAKGATVGNALVSGRQFLMTAVGTMLSDTGRTAEKVTAVGHHSTTFVRMLTPPSCGRCVILAGQTTRAQTAFLRHNRCDCRNVPSAESDAADLTVNPAEYLDHLSDNDLAHMLGSKANAQAYKDGADLNQLINAYRKSGDVRPAQMAGGRVVKVTTEGATRGGWARRAMTRAGLPSSAPRLMPESIYQSARSRDEAERLLRTYGWIL